MLQDLARRLYYSRLGTPIRRWQIHERDARNVDLVLANALNGKCLAFPGRYVEFLRACIEHRTLKVTTVKPSDSTAANYDTIVRALETLPPVPFPVAIKIAEIADDISQNNEAHNSAMGDVRAFAELSSSDGLKGRILTTIARFNKSKRILELGTCFGIGTLFLAEARKTAHITTVDVDEQHHAIASQNLGKNVGERVDCRQDFSSDALQKFSKSGKKFDFVFHDAGHTYKDYVEDFAAMLPTLEEDAKVLIDDIRWADSRFYKEGTRTYEGWRTIVNHERVRAAVEIEGTMGLLVVR